MRKHPQTTEQRTGQKNTLCQFFTAYKWADSHAYSQAGSCRPRSDARMSVFYSWYAIMGCDRISHTTKGLANHARAHSRNSRGPYQCSKCREFYAELHMLYKHETKSGGKGGIVRDWGHRIMLNKVILPLCRCDSSDIPYQADPKRPVQYRMIGGSPSSSIPACWYMEVNLRDWLTLLGNNSTRPIRKGILRQARSFCCTCNCVNPGPLFTPIHKKSALEKK